MKKFTFLFTLTFFAGLFLSAQQFQNPGFENWEEAGTVIQEPVSWSSIKTSDGGNLINGAAPLVWGSSADAHTGNYSVMLFNVATIGNIIATGTITNGRVHAEFDPNASFVYTDAADERWHTVLTGRPDSVALWAKYIPQGSDTARIQVLLHKDDASMPPTAENKNNWIAYAQIDIAGNVETWTRFVVPFDYTSQENPEYMLIILTSGAGTTPVEGSIAWYDDLELIYGPAGISDNPFGENLICISGNNLVLDKFEESDLKGSTLSLINMSGAEVFSTAVQSNIINIESQNLTTGLYMVVIRTKNSSYSQKIYLR